MLCIQNISIDLSINKLTKSVINLATYNFKVIRMEVKKEYFNFFVKTLRGSNVCCVDIHRYLVNEWGQENIPSVRQIQRIAKMFEERVSVKRQEGSGRPRTSRSAENVEAVRLLIEEDDCISLTYISSLLDIEQTSIYRILTKDLNKKSVAARWIPHKLSDQHKANRVAMARECLEQIHGGVVVLDEKWVYAKPLPTPQNERKWVNTDANRMARPAIARTTMSARKFHIMVGINFRGEYYSEVLNAGETVNAERYVQFLQGIVNTRRRGTLTIMHDNATPHTANLTRVFFRRK